MNNDKTPQETTTTSASAKQAYEKPKILEETVLKTYAMNCHFDQSDCSTLVPVWLTQSG